MARQSPAKVFPEPRVPFAPPHYVCYRTPAPLIMDGRLDEPAWKKAAWTEDFADIEGSLKPPPRFRTRAKLLWDSSYLYIGAELAEPDVWATLTARDSIIFQDNDFEVFIDTRGDTHTYYELELNALGTEWDLLLVRPYRDGGPAIHAWDIRGLKTRVLADGTLNNPADKDKGWTVEIALPLEILKEAADGKKPPAPGDRWRLNFSRVEYRVDVRDGRYEKVKDPQTGQPLPEDNWTWAPQGVINIHYPEMWGYLQFSGRNAGDGEDRFVSSPEEAAKWALRQVYYKQKTYYLNHGAYADTLSELGLGDIRVKGYRWPPQIKTAFDLWEAVLESADGRNSVFITQDGLVGKRTLL
ncbi:MAG: carbohydrate-binding family 9-like protein [Candidatus Aminicenantes bacterium RBG_16_63_16]|nr:MAG: carbohydrate-binding family 9-like protein [Candidatus Aminicenantes bacterium RBG_16_63_16]